MDKKTLLQIFSMHFMQLKANCKYFVFLENVLAGGDTSYVCTICHKGFLTAEDLRNHNENHLFSCSECNQAFNSQITLTKHSEEVCLLPSLSIQCRYNAHTMS